MLFYAILIAMALILFRASLRVRGTSGVYPIPFALFVLLLSIVGGMRDLTVGTDLGGYGTHFFENAADYTSWNDIVEETKGEYFYHAMNVVCQAVSSDIHFLFFVQEFIKILLVGLTAVYFRKQTYALLFVFFYLMFFYAEGLSCLRQTLAMSIIIFGMRYFYEERWLKYILCVAIAYMFHSSALFAVVPMGILFLYKLRIPMAFQIAILILVFVFSWKIMELLTVYTIFVEGKAEAYMAKGGIPFPKTSTLLVAFFFVCSLLFRKYVPAKGEEEKKWSYLYVCSCLYCGFLIVMSQMFEVAFRISWYFMPVIILQFLGYTKRIKKKQLNLMLRTAFVALLILHFIIALDHDGAGVVPYTSSILGI